MGQVNKPRSLVEASATFALDGRQVRNAVKGLGFAQTDKDDAKAMAADIIDALAESIGEDNVRDAFEHASSYWDN